MVYLVGYKKYLWTTSVSIIIQFIILKYLYPFPNFVGDSFNYLENAQFKECKNLWPIGYSDFLGIIHFFSTSDYVLIFTQWLLYNLAALYYYFSTVKYINFDILKIILYIFLFFNPVFIYLSNYILSDILFISMSLIWIAHIINYKKFKNRTFTIIHLFIIITIISIRFQGCFYLLISIFFYLKSLPDRKKALKALAISGILIGTICMINLISPFSIKRFTSFGSWQLANNALLMYTMLPYDIRKKDKLPDTLLGIQSISTQYINYVQKNIGYFSFNGFYLTDPSSPLHQYGMNKYHSHNYLNVEQQIALAPLYGNYAFNIIKRHPINYFKHYILKNIFNYYYPTDDTFLLNSITGEYIPDLVRKWFVYDSNHIFSRANPRFQKFINFFDFLPSLIFMILLTLIIILIFYWCTESYKYSGISSPPLVFSIYIFFNFIFGIWAAPIALRYELFNMIICFTLITVLSNSIILGIRIRLSNST